MIEIKNIYKKFGKLEVLNNINLSFKKGECIALIGPNGCGKTTLIKSILGMVIPTKGDIWFDEKSILKEDESGLPWAFQEGRKSNNFSVICFTSKAFNFLEAG